MSDQVFFACGEQPPICKVSHPIHLEKSKLAQHEFKEDHQISWNEAKILHIEGNSRYRKYKESAHMACMNNPISQPSLAFSPIWIPLIKKEVNTLQGRSYF
jgi:hypothetical protein